MKKAIILGCAVALLAGCFLADRKPPSCCVSVSFPAARSQSELAISPGNADVKEVLRVVDESLFASGFVRDVHPLLPTERNMIAAYVRPNGGHGQGDPRVYLESGTLRVIISLGQKRTEPANIALRNACDLLRNDLSTHFGAERVTESGQR